MTHPAADDSPRRALGAVGHQLVVDRFEGDLAVVQVDGGAILDLPRWMLPAGVREGEIVNVEAAGDRDVRLLRFEVDRQATDAARAEAEMLLVRLRRTDPGGDILV